MTVVDENILVDADISSREEVKSPDQKTAVSILPKEDTLSESSINKASSHELKENEEATSYPESEESKLVKREKEEAVTKTAETKKTKSEAPEDVNKSSFKPTEKSEQEDICSGTRITGEIITTSTCKHKSEGSIKVFENKVKGGEAPYTYSIDGENFDAKTTFKNLSKGDFTIKIKDKNGCVDTLSIAKVDEKSCSKSVSVIIAPEEGSYWHIPVKGEDASVTIKTKEGDEVYSETILSGNPDVWKGNSEEGIALPAGYYYFSLHYKNPEKDDITGVITIMR